MKWTDSLGAALARRTIQDATEQRAEVARLTATLDKVRALADPDGMPDLDPDDGWDLGYAYAMREVRAVLEES